MYWCIDVLIALIVLIVLIVWLIDWLIDWLVHFWPVDRRVICDKENSNIPHNPGAYRKPITTCWFSGFLIWIWRWYVSRVCWFWFCLGPRHKGDIALGQPPYSKMSDFPSSETSAEQNTTTNHTKKHPVIAQQMFGCVLHQSIIQSDRGLSNFLSQNIEHFLTENGRLGTWCTIMLWRFHPEERFRDSKKQKDLPHSGWIYLPLDIIKHSESFHKASSGIKKWSVFVPWFLTWKRLLHIRIYRYIFTCISTGLHWHDKRLQSAHCGMSKIISMNYTYPLTQRFNYTNLDPSGSHTDHRSSSFQRFSRNL